MKKKAIILFKTIILFALNVLVLIEGVYFLWIHCFIDSNGVFLFLGVLGIIACVGLFKIKYIIYCVVFRKLNWRNRILTAEEQEIIEDAKKLIKSVDENIVIKDFNVYKIDFSMNAYFYYDEITQELCVFIPFKILKIIGGKDLCFMATVHEALHAQNLKDNVQIFTVDFLEGLNQLLTVWLIENYSTKYKKPIERKTIASVTIKNKTMKLSRKGFAAYSEQVKMVQEIIKNSQVDLKKVYLNYIDLNPEFYKKFVSSEYLQ